jgi:hypothetical protein
MKKFQYCFGILFVFLTINSFSQQIINDTIINGDTLITGIYIYYNPDSLIAQNSLITGSSNVKFIAGQRVHLEDGFVASNLTQYSGRFEAAIYNDLSSMFTYFILKKQLHGEVYYASNKKIFFKYSEEYNGDTLCYKVYDFQRNNYTSSCVITNLSSYGLPNSTKYGDNYYELDCSSLEQGFYTLEVENKKKELFQLRFVTQ